jgi:cytochrome oxidase assembly protein ShyY1
MKPVTLTGVFSHEKEIQVQKMYRGEKGVQIITPFYTHIGKDGKPCAILVNRGWVPFDYKNQRKHIVNGSGTISGVLYQGDAKTKYSVPNSPSIQEFKNVTPYDFAVMDQLSNYEEASEFMLHMIDFEEDRKQILPSIPAASDLAKFQISPERHSAYENMWRLVSYAGVVANTAVWLYF